jgi:hypothetical protein
MLKARRDLAMTSVLSGLSVLALAATIYTYAAVRMSRTMPQ